MKYRMSEGMTNIGTPLKEAMERTPKPDGSLINEGTKEHGPVAFFKTADLKAAYEAGYCAGRIAPLLTGYKIGQEVKVTHLNHGGAVYNNKREIINANKQPHKTICIGRIVEIKQEGENGAVIVKCEGDDKFLPRFHFYPQDNGDNQIVEVLEQPKKSEQLTAFGEPVGEILLTNGDYKEVSWKNGKLPPVGAKLYTTPPQRTWVGLMLEEILETYRGPDGSDYVDYARGLEAKLKEKNT